MVFRTKSNVVLSGLKEEMLWALDQATNIFSRYSKDCILTSGKEEGHGDYSHHYKGLAVDVRSKHLSSNDKYDILDSLRSTLGHEYQVRLESPGKPYEHYHIEYDPRQI